MSELASGPAIQSGKAEGLLEFIDWVVKSGYGTEAAWSPRKSAVRQVLSTVEDSDDYLDMDVRGMDLDDYVDRYERKARGSMKAESVTTYRQRFARALDAYREFLETGQPPRTVRRPAAARNGSAEATTTRSRAKATSVRARDEADGTAAQGGGRLIDYPFPLQSGEIALLRLPVRMGKTDAERLAAFVRTLVLEPQLELTRGTEDAAEEG